MALAGFENDPEEAARRRYLEEGTTGPYGYNAPAGTPPPPAAMSTDVGKRVGPYGYGFTSEDVTEPPRQGATDRTANEDNVYGYPSEPDYGPMPKRPTMGGYYWGTGGLASHLSKQAADRKYQKALSDYEQQMNEREEKQRKYQRDYTAAERKETRARLTAAEKRQAEHDKALEMDSPFEYYMRGTPEQQKSVLAWMAAQSQDKQKRITNAWEAVQSEDPAMQAWGRKMLNAEIGQKNRSNTPDEPGGRKINSALWGQATKDVTKLDEDERPIPPTPEEIRARYDELEAAATGAAPPGSQPIADVNEAQARALEGKRLWNKKAKAWGVIRNGHWVPERQRAAATE